MAPMALMTLSEATGEERYVRAAGRGGPPWIRGANELGVDLWDRQAGILYRSIRRKRGWDRTALYANTAGAFVRRSPLAAFDGPLEVNPTDRPYHLGWILEAWSGREQVLRGGCQSL